MRFIYILLFLFIFRTSSFSCQIRQPKHEVRAVWLTTIGGIDWPHSYAQSDHSIQKQKKELCSILDKLQRAGINTVLLQTRIRGTLIYPSQIEPWDGCLSGFPGKSPGYDALQFAIEECHRRGMEIHAWVVTMPVGKWDGLGCKTLRKKMPNNIIKIKADGYMNPENEQTAMYLADLCAEIATRYDVDGIHLDYIRYPEEMPKLKTLSRTIGRENITRIVRSISKRVKSIKPWIKMSCSPIGKYDDTSRYWSHGWNANNAVCQDAVAWLRDGLMDELFPMMYFRDNNFFPFALDWKEQSHGRIVIPGLGIYFMSPREKDWPLSDITRELSFLRANDMGHAYFRSKFLTDDTKGIYRYAENEFCIYPALVPPMTWESDKCPEEPYGLSLADRHDGTSLLQWRHNDMDTTRTLFNVYSSTTYPVDTEDARNILAVRRQSHKLLVPSNRNAFYAVTATDRYGNESAPRQMDVDSKPCDTDAMAMDMLYCDGARVDVPASATLTDYEYLIVESLQRTITKITPHDRLQGHADVRSLPNGIYCLRTLNAKGDSHRLGMFLVKRP